MSYLFISGRTTDQAKGMHIGKLGEFYEKAVSMIEMNASDMGCAGFEEGDAVMIVSEWGEAPAWVKKSDIPSGMVFTPMGPIANAVTGSDTEGTGMPLFKGFYVDVKKIASDEERETGHKADER
jgi:formylmethanofuran dehydrogenase subunit D